MALPQTVTTAELSKLFGVSGKTVAAWATAGIVTRVGRGRFNLAKSVRAFAKHHKRSASDPTVGVSVGNERARVLRLQGDKLEHAMKIERGELVTREEGIAVSAVMTRLFRSGMLAFRSRLSDRLRLSREGAGVVYDEACALLEEIADTNTYDERWLKAAEAAIEADMARIKGVSNEPEA